MHWKWPRLSAKNNQIPLIFTVQDALKSQILEQYLKNMYNLSSRRGNTVVKWRIQLPNHHQRQPVTWQKHKQRQLFKLIFVVTTFGKTRGKNVTWLHHCHIMITWAWHEIYFHQEEVFRFAGQRLKISWKLRITTVREAWTVRHAYCIVNNQDVSLKFTVDIEEKYF